jgi:hypothetical protein
VCRRRKEYRVDEVKSESASAQRLSAKEIEVGGGGVDKVPGRY